MGVAWQDRYVTLDVMVPGGHDGPQTRELYGCKRCGALCRSWVTHDGDHAVADRRLSENVALRALLAEWFDATASSGSRHARAGR
jgi:hypothetical protein